MFQEVSGKEKVMKRRGVSRFSAYIFVTHFPKKFVREPFCVAKKV